MAAGNVKRLALAGYGRIASSHLEAFRSLDCEFVACCNRSAKGRQSALKHGGFPRVYADIPTMLETEKPDGVVCCVSFDEIYDAALEILPYGIPTLLEKPPATSLQDFIHLKDVADRHGAACMVGLNRRHYSVLQRALKEAGGFKSITSVSVAWSEDPQRLLARGFQPDQIAKMVFGNSLHGLDLLTYLAGPIIDPCIITVDLGDPFRWQMALNGVSNRGVIGSFISTWDSPCPWTLQFSTEGRRYWFAPLEACEVRQRGTSETRVIEPDEFDRRFKPGFHRQSQEFVAMIDTKKTPEDYSLDSVRPAMILAEALTGALMATSESQGV